MGILQMQLNGRAKVLQTLDKMIDNHEATNNSFFDLGVREGWSREEVRAFGPDYFHWVREFPRILAGLVNNAKDEESWFFLTEILYSELGSGDRERIHSALLARILRKLDVPGDLLAAAPRLRETRKLVSGLEALYTEERLVVGMGAQYALERQAFPMLAQLYEGFKGMEELTAADFEYFEIHLVEEPEHLRCMQNCMERYIGGVGDLEDLRRGVSGCLDLIATFWRAQYREVVKARSAKDMKGEGVAASMAR